MIFMLSPGKDVSSVNFITSFLDAKHNVYLVTIIRRLYSEQIQPYEKFIDIYSLIFFKLQHLSDCMRLSEMWLQ